MQTHLRRFFGKMELTARLSLAWINEETYGIYSVAMFHVGMERSPFLLLPTKLCCANFRGGPALQAQEGSGYQFYHANTKREAKKDIEDKTSVFSRLPRPVDQQIYGPYFSDILPCAIHSGRSRTHTIFTLSGISFEAGILLLQDLGLFYSAV